MRFFPTSDEVHPVQSFRSVSLPFLLRTAMAAMLIVLASIPVAGAQQVGDAIELNAEHADGVPLHAGPRPSMTGRVADGSGAVVIGATADKHWLNVRLPDGRTGWIVPRYIGRVVPSPNMPGKPPAQGGTAKPSYRDLEHPLVSYRRRSRAGQCYADRHRVAGLRDNVAGYRSGRGRGDQRIPGAEDRRSLPQGLGGGCPLSRPGPNGPSSRRRSAWRSARSGNTSASS